MVEIFIIGVIILGLFFYSGRIDSGKFVADNKDLFNLLKESDYEFLLYAKYGDRVIDPDAVFMKRIRNGVLVSILCIFVFISKLSFLNVIISVIIGFLVFKSQYMELKRFYKNHLNEVDSLLPYYLKGLEVLVQHYTVPVALARSIEDAPEVFKPGLKAMVAKIESGDSSVQPYMDFAAMYPVRDSVRMMRLLYRLGLGEQEKKHDQLIAFSKSVSSLQQKAREQKYKNRLSKMESMTMAMLVCTGGGGMLILLVSMFMLLASV
ncbi:MAG: hypothetical protein MR598_06725 [Erysipelotrichaceae bacterium]|nr:hypothetical protein [Erysipelotrichaceae bacterium]